MKVILVGTAFALMASVAPAQETALDYALAQDPVPCGGADNIEKAEFHIETKGARVLRVTCKKRGLFAGAGAGAPAGAPATGFVPAFGLLGPILGIGAAAGAVALAGGGGGSSTSDTQ